MLKSTVCNLIGAKYGYRSYLEISTPTTGWQDHLIDKDQFTHRELLVYALPSDRHDKPGTTYRTSLTTSSKLVRAILASHREPYDLVFVDPHHTYENSYEDLIGALELVRPGGTIVVHDCNPTNPSIAQPQYQSGEWCGVTYWAFIDLVLGRSNIRYFTVDCDYGCGVIYKLPHAHAPEPRKLEPATLELEWAAAKWSDDGRYQFFDRNRAGLLNLWTVDEFISREGLVLPPEVAEPGGPARNEEAQLLAAS
jgi:hypothetical protein